MFLDFPLLLFIFLTIGANDGAHHRGLHGPRHVHGGAPHGGGVPVRGSRGLHGPRHVHGG